MLEMGHVTGGEVVVWVKNEQDESPMTPIVSVSRPLHTHFKASTSEQRGTFDV